MLLLDAYSFVFYRLYRFSCRWKHDLTPPHVTAFLGIVFIVWCTIFVFLEIIDTVLAPNHYVIPHLSKGEIYLSLGLLAVPLYFAFIHRRRYQQIAKRYESETPRQRLVRGAVVLVGLALLWALGVSFAVLHAARLHRSASNQSLEPTALWRCASMSILIRVVSTGAQPRRRSGGSAPSR
jgi:hypothetical protein